MKDETACPRCGSKNTRPIVYGYPGDELMEAAKKGEVQLGGCIVWGNDPDSCCLDCKHAWRSGPATGTSGEH